MAFFQNQSKKSGNRVTILRGVRSVSFPAVIFVVVARDVNIATFILYSRNLPDSNSDNHATSELHSVARSGEKSQKWRFLIALWRENFAVARGEKVAIFKIWSILSKMWLF